MKVDKKILQSLLDKVAGDDDAFFYALANSELKKRLINLSDPIVNRMPKSHKDILMEGKGIALDNKLLVKFACGETDRDTAHVLEMCDIMLHVSPKISI